MDYKTLNEDIEAIETAQPPPYQMPVPQAMPILSTTTIQAPQQGAISVGPKRQSIQCPFCLATVKTRVRHVSTSKTHTNALLISLFCGWICCCCCLPYCCNSCRNANHYCPNCKSFIGTYQS